jgi:hypothetical protein
MARRRLRLVLTTLYLFSFAVLVTSETTRVRRLKGLHRDVGIRARRFALLCCVISRQLGTANKYDLNQDSLLV